MRTLALFASVLSACTPCASSLDCDLGLTCSEGFCQSVRCEIDADCVAGRCVDNSCALQPSSTVTILSPAPGATVAETFAMDVRVVLGRSSGVLEVRARDNHCHNASFVRQVVDGQLGDEVIVHVEELTSAGGSFDYDVDFIDDASVAQTTIRLAGPAARPPDEINSPVLIEDATQAQVALSMSARAGEYTVYVEAATGPVSIRQSVRAGTDGRLQTMVPLAVGDQLVVVENDDDERCEIHVIGQAPSASTGLDIALAFDSAEPANLDLIIRGDLDDGGTLRCSSDGIGPCDMRQLDGGFLRAGGEALGLSRQDGVYGLVVRPSALVGDPRATIRITEDGAHRDFFGPRRVPAASGLFWLAGRVYIVGVDTYFEPLDRFVESIPTGAVTSW